MKRRILFTTMLTVYMVSWAQGPNDSGTYYKNANGMYGASLKTAMYNIISKHKDVGYNQNLKQGQIGLKEAYKKTDVRQDGYLRDWYSNITSFEPGAAFGSSIQKEGDGYNREHLMPQSWYNKVAPMVSDVMQVVPTDGWVNSRRSDNPFGEVVETSDSRVKTSVNAYSKWGTPRTDLSVPSGVNTVFEPNDEIKGDIARVYFYMATCYEDRILDWKGNNVAKVIGGTAYSPLLEWEMDVMLRWSKQDPVDPVEIARNNAVYGLQNNRNPFVDYPGLEDYIWGDKAGEPFCYDNFGGGVVSVTAMPVFTPDAGTYYNSVEVTLQTVTPGATIYYTTSGAPATEQSTVYEGPFTLTGSCTVKAIAVKDGVASTQAVAVYNIKEGEDPGPGPTPGPGPDVPTGGTLVLNNSLFGTSYTGTNAKSGTPLKGSQNGVTVSYALGTGSYLYCNEYQIRLYKGNLLTFSVSEGTISELQFEFDSTTSSKALAESGNALVDGKWQGNSKTVTITYSGSSGHVKLTGVKVGVSVNTGAEMAKRNVLDGRRVIYNLSGQRILNPTHGLYIVDGKKVFIQ